MISKRKRDELEKAQNRKVFDMYLSKAEGRICLYEHVQAFHWPNSQGDCLSKCGVADCGCEAYDENVFAKIEPFLAKPTRQAMKTN